MYAAHLIAKELLSHFFEIYIQGPDINFQDSWNNSEGKKAHTHSPLI